MVINRDFAADKEPLVFKVDVEVNTADLVFSYHAVGVVIDGVQLVRPMNNRVVVIRVRVKLDSVSDSQFKGFLEPVGGSGSNR